MSDKKILEIAFSGATPQKTMDDPSLAQEQGVDQLEILAAYRKQLEDIYHIEEDLDSLFVEFADQLSGVIKDLTRPPDDTPKHSAGSNFPPPPPPSDGGDGNDDDGTDDLSNAVNSLTGITNQLINNTINATSAVAGTTTAANNMGAIANALATNLLGIAQSVAQVNAVISAVGTTADILKEGFKDLTKAIVFFEAAVLALDKLGEFSADVQFAKAESQIRLIEDKLAIAEDSGSTIATLEEMRSEISSELRQIGANFAPLLEVLYYGIEVVLAPLLYISKLFKSLHDFIFGQDDKEKKTLQGSIDDLFGNVDVPFDIDAIRENIKNGSAPDQRQHFKEPASNFGDGRFNGGYG